MLRLEVVTRADHPRPCRQLGIVARRPEMMRVHHAHHGDVARLRLLDGARHGLDRYRVAEAVPGIEQGAGRPVAQHLRTCAHVEGAAPEGLVVLAQHVDAVGIHPPEVGLDHHARGGLGEVTRHSPGRQDREDLAMDQFGRNPHGHGSTSPPS